MKKIISTIFTLVCLNSYSQGNLQFNKVVNYDLSGILNSTNTTLNYTLQTVTITVPIGKVLKIESANVRSIYTYPSNIQVQYVNTEIILDNVVINREVKDLSYNQIVSNSGSIFGTFPIWLSSGSHTLALICDNPYSLSSSLSGYGKVTAIEFNVLP